MNLKTTTYWATTAVLAFVMLSGGAADLVRLPAAAQGVYDLGYPPMFLTILGFWKVLGGVTVLAPRLPRLKEWAYAGAFFDLSGATVSHLVAGSSTTQVATTAALSVLTLVSWATRPSGRMLGALTVPAVLRRDEARPQVGEA
ncbi:membrane protein [Catellatospora sp. TT07R-123]|uniref:DoxX family protein n=1 Tax=Catellatospora sp. TT07R-123 TaxID=2733863 RepID=UPI001AFD4A6E|nr:DoxX family protein [Catellatospora sp. TT07R-123]GHJ48285.1 membrane protein [Catellatospora sp. TT07R-123]